MQEIKGKKMTKNAINERNRRQSMHAAAPRSDARSTVQCCYSVLVSCAVITATPLLWNPLSVGGAEVLMVTVSTEIYRQPNGTKQRWSKNYLTCQTSLKNTSSGFKVGGRRVARCVSSRRMHTSTTFMGLQINRCIIITLCSTYSMTHQWPSWVCK